MHFSSAAWNCVRCSKLKKRGDVVGGGSSEVLIPTAACCRTNFFAMCPLITHRIHQRRLRAFLPRARRLPPPSQLIEKQLKGQAAHVTRHKRLLGGLPWWRSGWESACQCRGRGFKPWSGKIPHVVEQLGPSATTTEPERLEPVLCNKRGHDSERPVHRNEE